MKETFKSQETMERKYFFAEERDFYDRAHADRAVGTWAAGRLGKDGLAAIAYAERVIEAGAGSADGRGGFDFVVAALTPVGVKVDEIRNRYALVSRQYAMAA